ALVFGFSRAETDGWTSPLTLGLLAGAVVLLLAFVAIEARVRRPLLPLSVVSDRNRGGAYLAAGLVSIGMFVLFLFLTYYLQHTPGSSPVPTGRAFLPMVGAIMLTATTSTAKLLPRLGARPLIPTGMALAAVGMVFLTGIGIDSSYAADVLPGLLVMGLGVGLVMAPAMNTATAGVSAANAGVASAMVKP